MDPKIWPTYVTGTRMTSSWLDEASPGRPVPRNGEERMEEQRLHALWNREAPSAQQVSWDQASWDSVVTDAFQTMDLATDEVARQLRAALSQLVDDRVSRLSINSSTDVF